MGIRAHSTRSVAASKAFLASVPIQDICNATGWPMPLTFIRFYGHDMRTTPGSSVLSPSSCSWGIHTGQGLGSLAAWASHSPKRLTGCSSSSWWGMPQATYVTLSPRRNEMLHLGATLPASPPAFFLIPWSWCRLHRTCFYTSWSLLYPPVMSRPSFGLITHDIQSRSRWRHFPKHLTGCSVSFLRGTRVTYVTWSVFYNLLNSIKDYLYSAFLRYNRCKAALHEIKFLQ